MKIKIIDKFSYQAYPITDDMIEVNEETLREIGKTKCFENGKIIDYDNSNEFKELSKQKRIAEIKQRLDELNKDFIQYYLGAVIENIEDKKIEFISLHNELRELIGKEPRIYK